MISESHKKGKKLKKNRVCSFEGKSRSRENFPSLLYAPSRAYSGNKEYIQSEFTIFGCDFDWPNNWRNYTEVVLSFLHSYKQLYPRHMVSPLPYLKLVTWFPLFFNYLVWQQSLKRPFSLCKSIDMLREYSRPLSFFPFICSLKQMGIMFL